MKIDFIILTTFINSIGYSLISLSTCIGKRIAGGLAVFLFPFSVFSQSDSLHRGFEWSGYVESYIGLNQVRSSSNAQPSFVYSFHREREVNINLALIRASYSQEQVRANLGLMAGTYVQRNLAAEPNALQSIWEANVGVRLSKKKDIWLDAGLFPSHIGFESAIGADCWTASRSILADNSPYFETGGKLTMTTSDKKWVISGLLLNGWQRIQRPEGSRGISGGHQVTWKPSSSWTLNSSSFIGKESALQANPVRIFHNFYAIWQGKSKWGMILGLDTGWQKESNSATPFDVWMAPVAIFRYQVSSNWTWAARIEQYRDRSKVMISADTDRGVRISGVSINLDRRIFEQVLWRVEGKFWHNPDPLFQARHGIMQKTSLMGLTTLSFRI